MANSAPHLNPVFTDKDATNSNAVNAISARYGVGALSQPASGSTFTWAPGVFPSDSSGTTISDYAVSQTTPSATMAVLVQPGQAQVHRSLGGPYISTSTASFTVTIGASNTSPRIDYLVMRFRDIGLDSSGAAVATYAPIVLPGTPSGSPVEPTGSLTDGDLLVAAITVRANTTSILTTDIADRRVWNVARGGIYPKSSTDARDGAYPGHTRYNLTTGAYEGWDGAAWQVIARPVTWSTFTPTLTYQGSTAGGGTGSPGTVNLGAGNAVLGRYLSIGKTLHLRYVFFGGTSPSAGTGAIYSSLPSGFVSAANGESHILAKLNTTDGSVWLGDCFIPQNSTDMRLYMPLSKTDCRLGLQVVATSAGTPGTGTPNITGAISDVSILVIEGAIEIQ